MEINDRVFVRMGEGAESEDMGTVIDFSDGMVFVVFDGTGQIGSYLKAELVLAGNGVVREKQSSECGGE